MCSVAMEHVNGTFQEFENDFCQNASSQIRAIAAAIDQDFSRTFTRMVVLGAVSTVAMNVGSRYLDEKSAEECKYASYAMGLATLGLSIFVFKFAY